MIIKRLKNYWKKLSLFNKAKRLRNNIVVNIPEKIGDGEKIVRTVFSPININFKTNTLKTNAFRSPGGYDEISVNRLDYTNADYCKKLGKKIENPDNNRAFFGLAVLIAREIRDIGASVIYSPIKEPIENLNPYHADIKVGYVFKKGEQPPAEISYIISKLRDASRLYIDPNPESDEWGGNALD